MTTISANGIDISYREAGKGRPLVFLHAFPLNQTMWDEQIAVFSEVHRVVSFDWRGFGGSTLDSKPSTMDVFADDLAALLDALSIERASICGLSMGGYAAFGFQSRHTKRLASLILADTRATGDSEEGRQNRRQMATTVREAGPKAIADQMLTRLLGSKTLEGNPAVAARVRAMIESNESEGIARALLGMADRPDSTPLLGKIECPTLIVVGSDDTLTPPSESEAMAASIAGSRLVIILDAGHLANLERPEQFNQALAGFLSSL